LSDTDEIVGPRLQVYTGVGRIVKLYSLLQNHPQAQELPG